VRALLVLATLLVPGTAFAQSAFRSPPPEPPPLHPPQPQVFISFSAGSGLGVLGGRTEALEADVATGAQWAPMHFRAELAAFRNPQLAFAISARLGYTFGDTGDPPAAKAVLLRVYRMCSPLGLRFNGAIGAGYLRYRVGVDGTSKDTMAAGPVIAGGGVGYVVPISKSWRVTVDVNAYAAIASSENYGGVPNEHALHIDLDVGLAVFR
jgi:hypothetical protein